MSTRSGSQAARNDHAKIARAEEGSAAAAALNAVAAQAKANIAAENIFAAAAKMLQLQHTARAEESTAATFEGVAAEATTDSRLLSRRNEKPAAVTPDTALEDVA